MIAILFQFFIALVFVILVCIFHIKITLPMGLKIFDLTLKSKLFRVGICIFFAVAFSALGVMQLTDFIEKPTLRCFPFSFLNTGIFLFLGLHKRNFTKS